MKVNVTKQFAIGTRNAQAASGGFPAAALRAASPVAAAEAIRALAGAGAGGGGNQQVRFAQGWRWRPRRTGRRSRQPRAAVAMRSSTSRYNLELFIRADNVLNNVNYGGYSGTGSGRRSSASRPARSSHVA